MDYLDPKKLRRHAILLYTGYFFIGVAVIISTIILLYQANGFGFNNKRQLVQNGLVFVSSQPNPATIYLNDKKNNATTNTRLSLPAGSYNVRLSRAGYHDWNRTINVQGGDVQNFDYPFLFPKSLDTSAVDTLTAAPGMATQSRDRRWLLVQQSPTATSFNVYDLTQKQIVAQPISLPDGIVTPANGAESWEAVQWSNDNDHVLVKHTYGSGSEYVIISRTKPEESVNLNKTFTVNPSKVTLIDNKYDQYHLLVDGALDTAQLGTPTVQKLLPSVLDYKSYNTDTIVYVTDVPSSPDKVDVDMMAGNKNFRLRQIAKSSTYPLDIASYAGDQYVVLGGSSENLVYVYKNPVQQLNDSQILAPAASRALRVADATHVSFSPNTQFIMAENGTSFAVYDLHITRTYLYTTATQPIDAPQTYAQWMDGYHLTYTTGGKQLVFDYDHRNSQLLIPTLSAQDAHFSQDYRYIFSFSKGDSDNDAHLNRTALRTPTDL